MSESLSLDLMVDSVNVVLDYLDICSCVIMGNSMGGYVTLAFAEKYPESLQGFGLFHSQAAADSNEAMINRYRTIQRLAVKNVAHYDFFGIPDNILRFVFYAVGNFTF